MDASTSTSAELLNEYLSAVRPLVSVICISYNHEPFITAALNSVLTQDYAAVEVIVVDNNSTDGTLARLDELVQQHPQIRLIRNPENVGICRAFNQGLAEAAGRYVIDLSADDVLHPTRIGTQVRTFERLPADYAVVFSNADFIDETDRVTGYHFPVDREQRALVDVPTGWVFRPILDEYFVCTPTMMMRKSVLDSLGGYDETLTYEDFDFWVRSARQHRYFYIDEVLTSKRVLRQSLSTQFSRPHNALLRSTLTVCYKAFDQCQTPDEYKALARRLRWGIRQCFYAQHYGLAFDFRELLEYIEKPDWQTWLILQLCRLRVPVNKWYRRYVQHRLERLKRPVLQ